MTNRQEFILALLDRGQGYLKIFLAFGVGVHIKRPAWIEKLWAWVWNKIKALILFFPLIFFVSCASLRSHPVLQLQFSSMPPRAAIRAQCNDKTFSTQGTVVCEQREPSNAAISVKIPPVEGRVVFSNGQLKNTSDFNWYPESGILFWKHKTIKDTWIPLDLGEIASTFGDWPVSLDIIGNDPDVGVIVTRGIMFYRICNDKDVPCSHLVVKYNCAGHEHVTGENNIGKCDRLSGSTQAFEVQLKGSSYQARPGAKLYVSAPRLGVAENYTPKQSDFDQGVFKFELPTLPSGPSLIGIRLAWVEDGKIKQVETRVLIVGYSPDWTGLDLPHTLSDGENVRFVKPVFSDVMEVDLYGPKETLIEKNFGKSKSIAIPRPDVGEVACAFAWQRDSSDQTFLCVDPNMKEVGIP